MLNDNFLRKNSTRRILSQFLGLLFALLVLVCLFFKAYLDGDFPIGRIDRLRTEPMAIVKYDSYKALKRPDPITVVVGGPPRSGSTWVYNIVNVLMRFRDPNTVSGYIGILKHHYVRDKSSRGKFSKSWLDLYRSLGTSVLIKIHKPENFEEFAGGKTLGKVADLTVLAIRDLRTEVSSVVYKRVSNAKAGGRDTTDNFKDPGKWVEIAHDMIKMYNRTRDSVGERRFIHVKYEDWANKPLNDQIKVAKRISEELSMSLSAGQLENVVVEVSRMIPPKSNSLIQFNPVTNIHKNHIKSNTLNSKLKEYVNSGIKEIEKDSFSRNYLEMLLYR